jgi:hypothetical protein
MKSGFKLFGNVILRIIAVFTAQALGVIGAGAVAGISTIKAMSVAGITAVAAVIEKLARGFMDDGKLTMDEINAAFAAVDTKAATVADLQVQARQQGASVVVNADGSTSVAAHVETSESTNTSAAVAETAITTAQNVPNDPHYN